MGRALHGGTHEDQARTDEVRGKEHLDIASFRRMGVLKDMSYRPSGRGYGGGSGGYGGGFGRESFGKKPVEVGKEYDVEITEISRRGDGIAKIEGFVIFVSGAKAQTKVRIKITSVGPRFASAQLVSGQSEGTPASQSSSGPENQPAQ